MNHSNARQVYSIVKQIPKGNVATYGQVAKLAKIKNPRSVGYYLHINPDPSTIPCHRVVNVNGKLAEHFGLGGLAGHKRKLEAEGVVVKGNKIDLSRYLWDNKSG